MSQPGNENNKSTESFISGALPVMNPEFRDRLIFDAGFAAGSGQGSTAGKWQAATALFGIVSVGLSVILVAQSLFRSESLRSDLVAVVIDESINTKGGSGSLPVEPVIQPENSSRAGILRVGNYDMVQDEKFTPVNFSPDQGTDRGDMEKVVPQTLTPRSLPDWNGAL